MQHPPKKKANFPAASQSEGTNQTAVLLNQRDTIDGTSDSIDGDRLCEQLATINECSISELKTQRDDDELLIILSPPSGIQESSQLKDAFVEPSWPTMRKAKYNAVLHFGFGGENGARPYIVIEWTGPSNSNLERRWVLGQLATTIKSTFQLKKLYLYFADGCQGPELAMAEDLAMSSFEPLYRKCLWHRVRLAASPPTVTAIKEIDPYRPIRLNGGLAYRQWINCNPDELTSLAIEADLEKFCHGNPSLDFRVLKEADLDTEGLALLRAVGRPSKTSPSRLILVQANKQSGRDPLLLIGKGITFDTGGINLKPHEAFVNCMKNDMGGAALMVQIFKAVLQAGYKQPLVLAIPACENLIDGLSMKPGSIYRSYSGRSVIVEHTDAEGRLILADAIAYAQQKYRPYLSCTAATLTTAALRQFTNYFTAVHFAPTEWQTSLTSAGQAWGEEFTFWSGFLPFLKANCSKAADLTNMGRLPAAGSLGGGSSVAAHFLREFSNSPLVHLDIFASCWNWSGDYPGAGYGATGAPFNSLFQSLMILDQ